MSRALLVLLLAVASAYGAPYVWNISTQGTSEFSLCLGERPSDKLRQSLLMCRELAYEFCVNSSLIGSVLTSDGVTAAHFLASAAAPSIHNIEKLAWLIDSALVVLYETFSVHRAAQPVCVHEWRAWICSRAFRRARNDSVSEPPLPVCSSTCQRVQDACNTEMHCVAAPSSFHCTDFYRDSGGDLCTHSGAGNVKKLASRAVPVFKHTTGAADSAASSLVPSLLLCSFLFVALFSPQLFVA